MGRLALTLLIASVAAAAAGCASKRAPQQSAVSAPTMTPMRFRRMSAMMAAAQSDRARGDAALLRRRSGALANEGLALIKATLPHDVARTDVPRYLDGRAIFGEALKGWVNAVESGTDAQLFEALDRLDGTLRGWIDAYTGAAPETSV